MDSATDYRRPTVLRVLVVADHPAGGLLTALKGWRFDAEWARTDPLDACLGYRPHVAVVDLADPAQLAAWLRALPDPPTVVAVADAGRLPAAGAAHVLPRPIDLGRLRLILLGERYRRACLAESSDRIATPEPEDLPNLGPAPPSAGHGAA